jgi:hypothetical protein
MFEGLFISKEERNQKYNDYSKRIFPYGDKQKDKVSSILSELFPHENLQYLLMHYILLKERVIEEGTLDYESAFKKVSKKKIIKISPDLQNKMIELLKADLSIDESLEYPSAEEVKNVFHR